MKSLDLGGCTVFAEEKKPFTFQVKIGQRDLMVFSHYLPHYDELACFGTIIRKAQGELMNEWMDDWCGDGILSLGTGGGQCDDHADHLNEEEKKATSAFQLLLETLNLSGEKEYKHLEDYANFEDNNLSRSKDNLAVVFWAMQRLWPREQIENVEWGLLGFSLKCEDWTSDFGIRHIYEIGVPVHGENVMKTWLQRGKKVLAEQEERFREAIKEYHDKLAKKEVLERKVLIHGKTWEIVGIRSDNVQSNAALRFAGGAGAGIVVQLNSNNNLLITTNRKSKASLDDVVAILRYKTQEKKGKIVTSDFKALKQEGAVPGAEEVFYHRAASKIYVGSLTHPLVSTALDFKTIFYSVYLGLDKTFFHPQFADQCKQDKCAGRKCSFFPFGRGVCRTIRYNQHRK